VSATRRIHAGAWWLWAIGLAFAASLTTDVIVLALIAAVAWLAVVIHGDDQSLRTLRIYAVLGAAIVVMRIVFRILVGGGSGGAVLFQLPELVLPDWMAGVRVGGPVTAGELAAGFADGLRLATIVFAMGAANALADPRRLLRSLPRALQSFGTAVVVAVGLAPQLVSSVGRVRRAMRARSGAEGRTKVLRLVNAVIDDALGRTMSLAVAMEVRGFGRPVAGVDRAFPITMAGLVALAAGSYGVLDVTGAGPLGGTLLVLGVLLTAAGLREAGRRRVVTVYRRDPWRLVDWVVTAAGALPAVAMLVIGSGDVDALHPDGLTDPALVAVLAIASTAAIVAAVPAWRRIGA
jgi:energy-coupling factor transport system permease protein